MWNSEKFRAYWEAGEWGLLSELYAPDAIFDVTVGPWRYQRRGRDGLVAQLHDDYANGAHPDIVKWVERPAPWGAVIEVEEFVGEDDDRLFFRYVHLLTVADDGLILEDTIFCSGAWDRATQERQRREAPMVTI